MVPVIKANVWQMCGSCNVLVKRQFCVKDLIRSATLCVEGLQTAFHLSTASCGFWRRTTHVVQLLPDTVELGFVSDQFHRFNAVKELHLRPATVKQSILFKSQQFNHQRQNTPDSLDCVQFWRCFLPLNCTTYTGWLQSRRKKSEFSRPFHSHNYTFSAVTATKYT